MRSLLLAGVACVALHGQAMAQAVVADPMQHLQTVLTRIQQAEHSLAQIRELQQQYRVMSNTYSTLTGARNIDDLTSALGGVSNTYLPGAREVMQGVGQGAGLLSGASRHMNADEAYMPDIDPASRVGQRWLREMRRRQTVTANAKAIAENGLVDMETRIRQLNHAEQRLIQTIDLKDSVDVSGLVSVTQSNLKMHENQIASIRLALAAEERTERQREEQIAAQGAAEWSARTQWAVDALGR